MRGTACTVVKLQEKFLYLLLIVDSMHFHKSSHSFGGEFRVPQKTCFI